MAKASMMKPGSGGGSVQNAKAQSSQRQFYGKGSKVAAKNPAKKPGKSGDTASSRKPSPLFGKRK